MAHGRQGPDIVMTIEYADQNDIDAMTSHELHRNPDSSSAIDPDRSHLNEVIHGPRTQAEAVRQMKAAGVKAPTKQAETPFVQIVISASPGYFRADLSEVGTWGKEKLRGWKQSTLDWLKKEYGNDLAHVALHLDEDTPHMHVLVVPTYTKKPRRPGRQKRNETVEEFEARRAVAETCEPVRTMSRSSNVYWKRMWVRREARVSYSKAMEPLGLGYGHDFVGSGEKSPDRKETAQWVREQAAEVNALKADLAIREQKISDQEQAFQKQSQIVFDVHRKREEVLLRREKYLDKKELFCEEISRRISSIVQTLTETLKLPLSKKISENIDAIEEDIRERESELSDPFHAPSPPERCDDLADDTGPGL